MSRSERCERALFELIRGLDGPFRTLLTAAPHAVYVIDAAGHLQWVNPAFENITGWPAATWLGRSCLPLFHADDRALVAERLRRLAAGERLPEIEARIVGRGGREVIGEFASVAHIDDGRVTAVLGIVRDVTARRQIETERRELAEQLRQVQKMDAIGQLAGGVAHDFNNILMVILGHSEQLQALLPAEGTSYASVAAIRGAAERGARLTSQLLSFSRPRAGTDQASDLNAAILRSCELLNRLIGEGVQLSLNLSDDPLWVGADSVSIDQLLMNLVVNARDAMPGGGVVRIATTRGWPSGDRIDGPGAMLTVSDEGCGMDESTRSRMFEPFFTTKTPGKGTGLGLSIAYGIVRQCGGTITASSELGVGTEFTVVLPLAVEAVRRVHGPHGLAPCGGDETILIVEDNDDVRSLVVVMTQSLGYNVLEAASGADAVQVARGLGRALDLVLTDVVMPNMSGPEVAREVGAIAPAARVLYMSGHADDVLPGREPGTDTLTKPFTLEQLSRRLRRLLDGVVHGDLQEAVPQRSCRGH